MWMKGKNQSRTLTGLGFLDQALQDRLMAKVNPVKVSQRDNRVREGGVRNNVADDLHSPCLLTRGAEKRALASQGLQPIFRFPGLLGVGVVVDQLLQDQPRVGAVADLEERLCLSQQSSRDLVAPTILQDVIKLEDRAVIVLLSEIAFSDQVLRIVGHVGVGIFTLKITELLDGLVILLIVQCPQGQLVFILYL